MKVIWLELEALVLRIRERDTILVFSLIHSLYLASLQCIRIYMYNVCLYASDVWVLVTVLSVADASLL